MEQRPGTANPRLLGEQLTPVSQRPSTPLDPNATAFTPTSDYKTLLDFPPLSSPPAPRQRSRPKFNVHPTGLHAKRTSPVLNAPTAPRALREAKAPSLPRSPPDPFLDDVGSTLSKAFNDMSLPGSLDTDPVALYRYQRKALSFAEVSAQGHDHVCGVVKQHITAVKARREAMAASLEARLSKAVVPAMADAGRLLGELELVLRELEKAK